MTPSSKQRPRAAQLSDEEGLHKSEARGWDAKDSSQHRIALPTPPPAVDVPTNNGIIEEISEGIDDHWAPALCLPNAEVRGLLIKWQPQPRALRYELRYRFRSLDKLHWGNWVSLSDQLESTRTLVPARSDAVYCFQVRAMTARGWGGWSPSSAVLRATSTGGAEFALSMDRDGSLGHEVTTKLQTLLLDRRPLSIGAIALVIKILTVSI